LIFDGKAVIFAEPMTDAPPTTHAMPDVTSPPVRRSVRLLVPLAIYAVHLGLVAYACPYRTFFGGLPLQGLDYATHFEQTKIVSEAIQRFGQIWAYDPNLLAGQPAGLFFDVDTRAHTLFAHALTTFAGLSPTTAYNIFPLLIHILAPLLLWLAARLMRTGWRAEMISCALGALLWHFDSAAVWCWWDGMISFEAIAVCSPLTVALFYRLLEAPGAAATDRRLRFLVPLALLLPLLLLTHVWAFATLAVPMVALYLRRCRRIGWAGHVRVWVVVAAAVGGNLFWLVPVLRHLDLLSFSGQVGQANPLYIIADYFDVFLNPLHTGSVATRTIFRVLAFCATFLTLWRWRKDKDPRLFVGAVSWIWPLSMAYFASLLPLFKETEPYRFILPALYFAAVLAGPWLASALTAGWVRELRPTARVVFILLLVLLVPRVVGTVAYFIPQLLPHPGGPPILKPNLAGPKAQMPTPEFFSFRHDNPPDDYRQIAAWLRDEGKDEGRVLVEWWVLAEYLRGATDRQIIGGFPDRRMAVEASNLFRYREDPRYHGQAFADYLVRYNIRYIIVSNPYLTLEKRRELLEPKRWIGYHRIYRVRHLVDYFARGTGKVTTSLNRIEISDARPEPGSQGVMLKYHYLKTLRCRPIDAPGRCRIDRTPLPDNPVGFISVFGEPKLPERFVIENVY
jgi:hypothetical protein